MPPFGQGLPSDYVYGVEETTPSGSTSYTSAQAAGLPPIAELTHQTQATPPAAPTTTSSTPPPATATATTQNPTWVYAVNMPSTYPDYAAMAAAGAGLVVTSDDPNAAALIAGARQWGIPVAIQVNAPPGITPEEYAARVAAAKQYAPDKLVLDIEQPGKGYEGSAGWAWSQQTAQLLQTVVAGTSVAVTMEPNQADYNYNAYKNLSGSTTEFWVQSYTGDMTPVDPNYAAAAAKAAGAGTVVTILAPHAKPPAGTDGYVSYGIPQNGATAAGVYAPGGTTPPGQPPYVPGTGPGYDPNSPKGQDTANTPGVTGPRPGQTGKQPTYDREDDWASIYFGSLGLPPDIARKVNDIFTKHPDSDQAVQLALAYIRGTPWYKDTFPGIDYGIQHGLIANELDYRQYVTAIDSLTMRYWNRHISGSEISGFLMQGLTPDIIGKQYEGRANLDANQKDYQFYLGSFGDTGALDQEGLRALSEQQVGYDSPLGQKMNRAFQQAMQRYQKLFEGQAASPSLSLGKGGLSAPSLLGKNIAPDVGA